MSLLRYLVCFAAAVAAVQGASHLQILGGIATPIKNAPFIVQIITSVTSRDYTFCDGSLISKYHVLTAGHCYGGTTKYMTVYVGSTRRHVRNKVDKSAVAYKVAKGQRHPDFRIQKWGDKGQYVLNNVAVLRLQNPVKLSSTVSLIKLVNEGDSVPAGSSVTVSGWGEAQSAADDLSNILRTASLKVLQPKQCRQALGTASTSQSFCTEAGVKKAFCFGDSGAPAYKGKIQYGIASFGDCAQSQKLPGVFVNLADSKIHSFVEKMLETL